MSDWPPISSVLSHYGFDLPPARSGWTPVKCVFHGETRASAAFHVGLSGYSCLACGIKGDGLKLIQEREGMGYAQAVEYARSEFGECDSPVRAVDSASRPVSASSRYRFGDSETVSTRFRGDSLFGESQ